MSIESLIKELTVQVKETNVLLYSISQGIVAGGDVKKVKKEQKEKAGLSRSQTEAQATMSDDGNISPETLSSEEKLEIEEQTQTIGLKNAPVAHTKEEILEIMIKVNRTISQDVAKAILKKFNVKKLPDVTEKQYNELYALCETALEEGCV